VENYEKVYRHSLYMIVSIINAQNKVGTTAAEFLTIPVGTKAMAMGGAFTGLRTI
jgi:hypothetical protein